MRAALLAAVLASCAHMNTCPPGCTPDPVIPETAKACAEALDARMCGYTEDNCTRYLVRESCDGPWREYGTDCEINLEPKRQGT